MKAVINQQSGTNSFFLKINKTNNKANLKGTKAFSSIIQSSIVMNNNGMKTLTEKPIELSVNELKDFLKNNKAEVFVKHDNQLINVTKLFLGNDSTPTKTIIENPLAKGKDRVILDKPTDLLIAKPIQERKITEVKVDKEESKSKKGVDNSLLIQLVINDININFLDKKETPKIETNSNSETPLKHKTTALQHNTQKADIKNIIQEKPQRKISENILQVPARKKAELVFASFTENKLTFDKIESKTSAEKPQMQYKLKDTGKPIELNNIRVEPNKAPESSDSIVNPIQRKTVSFDKTNDSISYKTAETTNHKSEPQVAKSSTDIEVPQPQNIKFISNEAIKSVKISAIEVPQTQNAIANVGHSIRNQSKAKGRSFKGELKPEKSEQPLTARQVGEERPINEGHKRTQRVEQFVDKKQESATISRTKTMLLQTVNLKSTNRINKTDNQSISEFKITENAFSAKNPISERIKDVPNAKVSFEHKAENNSSFLPKYSTVDVNKEISFTKEVNLKNDKLDTVKPFMAQISQKSERKDTLEQKQQDVVKPLPKEKDKSIKVESPMLPKEQVVNNASSVKHTFTGLNSTTIGKAAAMQNVENKSVYLAKPADRAINTERPLGVQNEPDIAEKIDFKQNTNDAVKSLPKREIKITRQSIPNLKITKPEDNKKSAVKISQVSIKKGPVHKASLDLKPQEVISTQSSKQEKIIKPEKIALKDIKQQNNKASFSFEKTSTFSQKQGIETKTPIEQKPQGVVSHYTKQTETIKQTIVKEPINIGLNTTREKPEFVNITQKVEDINKPEKIVSNKRSTESLIDTHIKQEPDVKFFSKQNSVEVSKPLSKQTEEIVKPEKIVSNKVPTESPIDTHIKQEPEVKFFSKQNSVEVSKPLSKQTDEIIKPEKIVSNKVPTESPIQTKPNLKITKPEDNKKSAVKI
ncbi:MAG TPA: hypothetical protein PL139_04235, partial [Candidatus Cloacimonadota bacterium]|nr:hypothetical protein [Candidatus Cloacimonadota bacterium]